ncbi:ATP-binding cassette sub-family A member 3-like [Mizuhopecten yessoensis]|uniref:ATP-binding cassette sub-family A member 3 n=1 Tax=Mizuhopecten yessoensis TaxID=6573 RepID=A0A210PDU7_MIZYE|nr:ATP-binding cassette sub-family A member 3-like [Mizuhopecten yessoensis]OWF34668.1 ATP-binding cassette sub-family A member 3 [Mizuhopecten yessoensis]
MGAAGQFLLLVWKNFTVSRRNYCATVFEVALPVAFSLLLLMLRFLVTSVDHTQPFRWDGFQLDDYTQHKYIDANGILYSPNNTSVRNVMNELSVTLGQNVNITGFPTSAVAVSEYEQNPKEVWAVIEFDGQFSGSSLPTDITYKLRVATSGDDRWKTDRTYQFFQQFGPREQYSNYSGDPFYRERGFLYLQYAIDKAIIDQKSPGNGLGTNYTVSLRKMPYPPYVEDTLLGVLRSSLPVIILFAFIVTVFQTTKNIVYEKEKKLKETMKLMGLQPILYWLSWFTKVFIYMLIACFFFTLMMAIDTGDTGSVLPKSSPTLIFVFLLLYTLAIIAFCFMMASIFSKATSAAFAAGVLYYLFFVPSYFLSNDYDTLSRNVKLATCLLHPMALVWGVTTITIYEGTGAGAQWTNFSSPATTDDNFSLALAMGMLFLDSVICFFIAFYLDNVKPGEFGVPKPWYFLCTKTYWCGTDKTQDMLDVATGHVSEDKFEGDPADLNIGINISHLRKVFGSGKKRKAAVVDTTLNMYEGQITALLGHNGAGKTTTMSMLTGFIPPTKGTAVINGCDIRKNIEGVRKSLGLCPQHNILFDNLTTEEHLWFFAKLKGCPGNLLKQEISGMLKMLGMEKKANIMSSRLSGGQKRKLSLGIALIADSKVVILDEPTSGMDPAARRETWEILRKYREGRTILLSTHFMDEADILGDRIAIMAEGVIKCCGTSLFLKKTYGAGYHLVVVKSKTCDVNRLTSLVTSHIPRALVESDISAELSYVLPFEDSPKFEKLFEDIEKNASSLGISSFGTTATTMEEVFLKVGEDGRSEDEDENETGKNGHTNHSCVVDRQAMVMQPTNGAGLSTNIYETFNKNTGLKRTFQQFYGMFVKKAINTWRNKVVTLVQLILPVVFTVLAFLSIQNSPGQGTTTAEPALKLDMAPFKSDSIVMYKSGDNLDPEMVQIKNHFTNLFSSYSTEDAKDFNTLEKAFLSKANSIGIATFNQRYIVAGDFPNGSAPLTAYFNGQPFHSSAVALSYMMNALLRGITNSSSDYITTINHPLPPTISDQSDRANVTASAGGFTVALLVLFGMAFLSTSFILFPIKERSTGAKHLQTVSGVSPFAYWLSNYCWDLLNYLFVVCCIVVVFAAFQSPAYVEGGRIGLVILVFCIYGMCCLPFVYLLHFPFSTPSTGMATITILNIISGMIALLAVFILELPDLGTEDVGNALQWVFTALVPHFCLGRALNDIYVNYEVTQTCEEFQYRTTCMLNNLGPCCSGCTANCLLFDESYMTWESPGILKYIVFMVIQAVVFFVFVLVIEYGVLGQLIYCICSNGRASHSDEEHLTGVEEDSDVKMERERIWNSPLTKLMESDALIVKGLSKSYRRVKAVNGISVGVASQECFGLLGQNGAGKTTTFKMITGDVFVDNGNAYLNSFDVKRHLKKVQQNLGYCPQFDALIDQMTGRETLTMYARLRGVPENCIRDVVSDLMNSTMLTKYADKNCDQYSGGNKRKLSTAIALIGDPPFILLDEPTTGMDPGARRKLWNVLSEVRARGRTLVLTSHSMEECDALCTKIVIMVNGRFVCLGSPQHLKNKFGQGYTLTVRLGTATNGKSVSRDDVKNYVIQHFPNTEVFDDLYQGYLTFQIPDSNVPLAKVFGTMERVKNDFGIGDYSVQSTALEQVFLAFTRNQTSADDKKKRKCCCFSC